MAINRDIIIKICIVAHAPGELSLAVHILSEFTSNVIAAVLP